MKRGEFEHAIRAAGAVLGVHEVLVIGRQALHASVPGDLLDEASRSVEADSAALANFFRIVLAGAPVACRVAAATAESEREGRWRLKVRVTRGE